MQSNEKSANNLQISQQSVNVVAEVQSLSTPQTKTRGLGGGGNARKRKFWAILASLISLGGGVLILLLYFLCVPAQRLTVTDWTDGLVAQSAGAETWVGSGTRDDPFILATAIDLAQLAVNVNAGNTYLNQYLTLSEDIVLGGKQWTPIGTTATPFQGVFNGQNHAIWYLTCVREDLSHCGFFGVVNAQSAIVSNIVFYNPYIIGGNEVGAVSGEVNAGMVSDCSILNSKDQFGSYLYLEENKAIVDLRYLLDDGGAASTKGSGTQMTYYRDTTMSGSGNIGGAIGKVDAGNGNTVRVERCVTLRCTVSSSDGNAGAIVGQLRGYSTAVTGGDNMSYIGCCMSGNATIKAGSSSDCGGIVGRIEAGSHSSSNKSGHGRVYSSMSINCTLSSGSNRGNIAGHAYLKNDHGHIRVMDNRYVTTNSYGDVGTKSGSGSDYTKSNNNRLYASTGKCTSSSIPSTYSATNTENYKWSGTGWVGIAPVDNSYKKTYYYPAPYQMTNYKVEAETVYNSYTISYSLGGGTKGSSAPTSYTASESKQTKTISNPTRSGYTFNSWSISRSGTYGGTAPTKSGTTLTIPAKSYGNITLTASWTAVSVTYYVYSMCNTASSPSSYSTSTAGGSVGFTSSCNYSSTSKSSTSTVTRYAKVKTGYVFDGWYSSTSYSSKLSSSTSYESTYTNLYAKFSIQQYTLTIKPNSGSYNGSTSNTTVTKYYGQTYSLSTPTRTGYTFNGWTRSGSGSLSGTTYTFGAGAGTVTASWSIITYTITVKSNNSSGGTVSGGGTINYGSSTTLTATPKEGYDFLGWKKDSSSSYVYTNPSYTISNIKANATYTAYFQIKTFSVSASAGNSGGTVTGGGTYNWGTTATITATPLSGYILDYWTVNGTKQTPSSGSKTLSFTVKQAYTIVAYFRIGKYITSASNGGEVRVIGGDSDTLSTTYQAIAYNGYYLNGWYINGEIYKVDGVIVRDSTITLAKSVGLGNAVRAIFGTTNGATPSDNFSLTTGVVVCASIGGQARINGYDDSDTTIHASAVNYKGYKFVGWYILGQDTALSTKMSCDFAKSTLVGKVLYAKFVTDENYNINPDLDNDDGTFWE